MSFVRVKCPECNGTGDSAEDGLEDGLSCSFCYASAICGTVLEDADKMRKKLANIALQAEIDEAGL